MVLVAVEWGDGRYCDAGKSTGQVPFTRLRFPDAKERFGKAMEAAQSKADPTSWVIVKNGLTDRAAYYLKQLTPWWVSNGPSYTERAAKNRSRVYALVKEPTKVLAHIAEPGKQVAGKSKAKTPFRVGDFREGYCRCRTWQKKNPGGSQCRNRATSPGGYCPTHSKKIELAGIDWNVGYYDEPRPTIWGTSQEGNPAICPGDRKKGTKIPWAMEQEVFDKAFPDLGEKRDAGDPPVAAAPPPPPPPPPPSAGCHLGRHARIPGHTQTPESEIDSEESKLKDFIVKYHGGH